MQSQPFIIFIIVKHAFIFSVILLTASTSAAQRTWRSDSLKLMDEVSRAHPAWPDSLKIITAMELYLFRNTPHCSYLVDSTKKRPKFDSTSIWRKIPNSNTTK